MMCAHLCVYFKCCKISGILKSWLQASYYMSHQSQSISLLEEADKQIREKASNEQLKRLKEARNSYREEVINCVRQCAW